VNSGKQGRGGGAKIIKKSASFLFEVSCSQRRRLSRRGDRRLVGARFGRWREETVGLFGG